MKLDIKLLITVITFAATMGGFYYSTQMRLDNLEEEVKIQSKRLHQMKRKFKR